MPKKAPERIGSVLRVPLSQLHPHPQNPFVVRDDSAMQELKESVSQNGVLVPAIARPRAEGGYELIAGHRRKYACEQAGQDSMPVIVLNLNDDEAVIQLVDSNIQREDILPSERARAYKMKMDAIKRQGARTDLTSPNISAKFRSDDSVGEKDGISGDTVRNYISLNNLTPPLMRMVDEKKIALTPAYQLAALSTQEQELLVETMSSEQATPSLSQAQRMRKLSQSGELNEDTMLSIMMEQKKPVKNDITLSGEKLRKRNDYLVLLSTDISLTEEEIIQLYGKRWDIEVFFKTCKSVLKLTKECRSLSYDAMCAQTAIVFMRYMFLAVGVREDCDLRSAGPLFYLVADELADISFVDAFEKLQLFLRKLLEGFVDQNEKLCELTMEFIKSLPTEVKQFLDFSGIQCISAPQMGCEV